MFAATVTSKGQITIPKEIRDHLRLETGDKVDFLVTDVGLVQMQAVERPLEDLYGFLHRPGVPARDVDEIESSPERLT